MQILALAACVPAPPPRPACLHAHVGAQEDGEVTAFFYRSLYLPHKGMFSELPADLSLGDIQVRSHPFFLLTILSQGLSECQAKPPRLFQVSLSFLIRSRAQQMSGHCCINHKDLTICIPVGPLTNAKCILLKSSVPVPALEKLPKFFCRGKLRRATLR